MDSDISDNDLQEMYNLKVTVYRIHWKRLRYLIRDINLMNKIEYTESKGFFKRTFTILSDRQTVIMLHRIVNTWR